MDQDYETRDSIVRTLGVFYLVCLSGLVFYRLHLSPFSYYPGPVLAASTKWYDFYYRVVRVDQYTGHLDTLHQQYGPVVRISPSQLHVLEGEESWFCESLQFQKLQQKEQQDRVSRISIVSESSMARRSDGLEMRRLALSNLHLKRGMTRQVVNHRSR